MPVVRVSINNSIPLPVVNLSASIASTRPDVISVASTSMTVPSRCSVSIYIVREFGLLVVSMLISTTRLNRLPERSPSCTRRTIDPVASTVLASYRCNNSPVERLLVCICNPLPVVSGVASTSIIVPSRCSLSILNTREFGLLVVSKFTSIPILADVPDRSPSCSIFTRAPA